MAQCMQGDFPVGPTSDGSRSQDNARFEEGELVALPHEEGA